MADTFRKEPQSADEREIYHIWRQINNAMIAKDRRTLEELYADDRKFVHMSGKTQTKEEYLNELMDGTLNYYHTDLHDIEIHVNSEEASLQAVSYFKAKVYGMRGTFPMHTEAHFAKRKGRWICVG